MIDMARVGTIVGPTRISWTELDTMSYALAVGAGSADPGAEREYTTDNSEGLSLMALPTMATVLGDHLLGYPLDGLDLTRMVMGYSSIELFRPLPVASKAMLSRRLRAIYDKGSGALLEIETECLASDGTPLFRSIQAPFLRDAGGFGGERGPSGQWDCPARPADASSAQLTRRDQPLFYRLQGDRHPLHSDPAYAAKAGFPRPIMHGLCTLGFAVRANIAFLGIKADRIRSVHARFAAPTFPGATIETSHWREADRVWFRSFADGRVVLDHGVIELFD